MVFRYLIALAVLFVGTTLNAATLRLNDNGTLVGANGVLVNDQYYDVSFEDGTCAAIFDGCDNPNAGGDFIFRTRSAAIAAAAALNDQVFIDTNLGLFDTNPRLTNGCSGIDCVVLIPYNLFYFQGYRVQYGTASNFNGTFPSQTGSTTQLRGLDTSGSSSSAPLMVMARFTEGSAPTPVPLPATGLLLFAALGGAIVARKLRK